MKKIFDKSFDYEISAGEPKNSVTDENKWQENDQYLDKNIGQISEDLNQQLKS